MSFLTIQEIWLQMVTHGLQLQSQNWYCWKKLLHNGWWTDHFVKFRNVVLNEQVVPKEDFKKYFLWKEKGKKKKGKCDGQEYLIQFLKGHLKLTSHQHLVPIEQTRIFLCEFPIGSYVKSRSTVAAILVGERDCRTQFWKKTIQWLFHQSLVLIEQLVPDKMVFMWISHRVLC
jgi:hypothetical protein